MRLRILIVVLLLASLACSRLFTDRTNPAPPQPQHLSPNQTGSFDGQITSSGISRHYRLHIPVNYRAGLAVPLIINFHGLTSNSIEEENLTGRSAKADQENFIVVYPDGLNATWYDGPGAQGQQDLLFVRDLIADLESQYTIDTRRIYATGISNGGGMTNRVGCNMADVIAAIAPDSGAYNFWQDCNPTRPMPVLAFHGLDDNLVPYNGGTPVMLEPPIQEWAAAWAARDGCNSTPVTTTPIDTVTVKATDVMWEFFKAHPVQ